MMNDDDNNDYDPDRQIRSSSLCDSWITCSKRVFQNRYGKAHISQIRTMDTSAYTELKQKKQVLDLIQVTLLYAVLIVATILGVVTGEIQGIHCSSYKTESGKKCFPCQAGYFKSKDCIEDGQQAVCSPCKNGTFQSDECSLAHSCAACSNSCPSHYMTIVADCTPKSDTKCKCEEGRFWNGDETEGLCLKFKQCPKGAGVYSHGTSNQDTQCRPCVDGETFSDIKSANDSCTVCTDCGSLGKVKHKACTRFNDTVCVKSDIAIIVGPVTGSVAFVAIVCCLVLLFIRKKHPDLWNRICCRKQPPCNNDIIESENLLPTDADIRWSRPFEELSRRVPWKEFKIFYRELPWGASKSSREVETLMDNTKQDHPGNIHETQIQLLWKWLNIWEKSNKGTSPTSALQHALLQAELSPDAIQTIISVCNEAGRTCSVVQTLGDSGCDVSSVILLNETEV